MEEKILGILGQIDRKIVEYQGSNMLEDGIIDSFILIEIISALEENFDIEFDVEDVIAENFANKEVIIKLVSKML